MSNKITHIFLLLLLFFYFSLNFSSDVDITENQFCTVFNECFQEENHLDLLTKINLSTVSKAFYAVIAKDLKPKIEQEQFFHYFEKFSLSTEEERKASLEKHITQGSQIYKKDIFNLKQKVFNCQKIIKEVLYLKSIFKEIPESTKKIINLYDRKSKYRKLNNNNSDLICQVFDSLIFGNLKNYSSSTFFINNAKIFKKNAEKFSILFDLDIKSKKFTIPEINDSENHINVLHVEYTDKSSLYIIQIPKNITEKQIEAIEENLIKEITNSNYPCVFLFKAEPSLKILKKIKELNLNVISFFLNDVSISQNFLKKIEKYFPFVSLITKINNIQPLQKEYYTRILIGFRNSLSCIFYNNEAYDISKIFSKKHNNLLKIFIKNGYGQDAINLYKALKEDLISIKKTEKHLEMIFKTYNIDKHYEFQLFMRAFILSLYLPNPKKLIKKMINIILNLHVGEKEFWCLFVNKFLQKKSLLTLIKNGQAKAILSLKILFENKQINTDPTQILGQFLNHYLYSIITPNLTNIKFIRTLRNLIILYHTLYAHTINYKYIMANSEEQYSSLRDATFAERTKNNLYQEIEVDKAFHPVWYAMYNASCELEKEHYTLTVSNKELINIIKHIYSKITYESNVSSLPNFPLKSIALKSFPIFVLCQKWLKIAVYGGLLCLILKIAIKNKFLKSQINKLAGFIEELTIDRENIIIEIERLEKNQIKKLLEVNY